MRIAQRLVMETPFEPGKTQKSVAYGSGHAIKHNGERARLGGRDLLGEIGSRLNVGPQLPRTANVDRSRPEDLA